MKDSNRHIVMPVQSKTRRGELESPVHTSKLFGEWQQHGPETLSGHLVRKLRLTIAPPQSLVTANAAG